MSSSLLCRISLPSYRLRFSSSSPLLLRPSYYFSASKPNKIPSSFSMFFSTDSKSQHSKKEEKGGGGNGGEEIEWNESGEYGIATQAVHAGQAPDPTTGARAPPIYQSTSFVFHNTQHAAELFRLDEPGNIYTRIGNPTNDVLEKRIAIMEGGVGALAVSSGSAAVTITMLNIMGAGDHIVSANNLYGGTYHLFADTLPRLGIETSFVDVGNLKQVSSAINERTKCIYAETIGNPSLAVLDISALAELAHRHNIPLIVDATFTSPYLVKPIQHGADIVIHSATKWIGGHGTSIGGLIVDGGSFNWANKKFPVFTRPDPSYNNQIWSRDWGTLAFIVKARACLLRDIGACISPINSFLLLQGLETLPLRMQKHCENALAVATHLSKHRDVAWVTYPGLPSHPTYHFTKKYFRNGYAGGVVVFGIKGGLEAGKRFIESLGIWSHLANVGDAKSLVIHPASTTHQQLSPEERAAGGITDDLIRLSVGIEDAEDLIADLDAALAAAATRGSSSKVSVNSESTLKRICGSPLIDEYTNKFGKETKSQRPITLAVVGLSTDEARPSFRVSRKMQRLGYKIIPVNPLYNGKEILGERCYSSLSDLKSANIPHLDCIQVFRSKDVALEVAKQAAASWGPTSDKSAPPVFWLQEGVISPTAARLATKAGFDVVMNRCTYKECQRFMGPMATYV